MPASSGSTRKPPIETSTTLPKVSTQPDQQRADERALDRADAADHDDDEADDQHLVAHAGEHRRHRRRDHPGERGERDAQREHEPIDQLDVDAKAGHHLAVRRAGPDRHAEPRAGDEPIHAESEHDAHAGNPQPVHRIGQRLGQADRRGQERGHRHAVHVVTPDDTAQLLGHQDQAVGEQHLVEVVAAVEPADQQPLEQHADRDRKHDAGRDREPQAAEALGERPREVRADHVEAAVREVDDPHDAEDQRQPARDQEQQQPVLDAVQELDSDRAEFHRRRGSDARGCRTQPPEHRRNQRRGVQPARDRCPGDGSRCSTDLRRAIAVAARTAVPVDSRRHGVTRAADPRWRTREISSASCSGRPAGSRAPERRRR